MQPHATDPATLDPFLPEHRDDPYPVYQRLRELAPVLRGPRGAWLVTRHAEAAAVLRDPRFSVDVGKLAGGPPPDLGPARQTGALLLFLDPPDHSRLRALVAKAFTPRVAEALRPRVEQLVADLLDQVDGKDGFDVIASLAYPLPVAVICELLGVPREDRERFKGWSSDASRLLDSGLDADAQLRGMTAALGLIQYFDGLFEERRTAEPGDDLLSALVAAEEAGDRLTADELRATTVLLFLAGHETTMNLIGNGLYALLRHGDQLERWRAEPALARTAVEELLRWDSPVQVTARIATSDVELGGVTVAPGEQVVVLLGAANRDPAVFAAPDRLDLGREPNRHLSFSAGVHFCLGASLARVEGQVALGALLQRMPDLELAEPAPVWREHLVLRGLKALRVARGRRAHR